ncbi:unnamed protein product [Rotaria socialis]|uniref:Uncharacterized protein n=1 Tax=Rotaria socialis TaxID=392032 RepID=A0A821VQ70_9BILA|nr:unnamed protein product [Rotaria socialis]
MQLKVNSEELFGTGILKNTHSYAFGNIKYFIDTAMQEGGRVDYYFTLQQVNNQPINESKMTLLKACDAHYIQHENKCVDIGTVGWFFNQYTVENP